MSSAIHHLVHTRLTPEVVLHRTLDDASRLKAVVILMLDKDDEWSVDRSQMSVAELCLAEKWLSIEATKVVTGAE